MTAMLREFHTGFFAACCDTKAGKEPVQSAKWGGVILCCFANKRNPVFHAPAESARIHGRLCSFATFPRNAAVAK
jgi:hypothetical protein